MAVSEKFIIMMDGMRINSPTGTPLAIVNNYPVSNARQIEIILGPASAIYGVDAFTGVINIITRDGTEAKGLKISSNNGNYNTLGNSIIAGVGNKDISFVLSGNYYYSAEPNFPEIYKDEYSWYNERYKTNGEMLVSPWDNTTLSLPIDKYETPTSSYAVHSKFKLKNFEVGYFRNYESHSSSTSSKPEFTLYSKEASFKFLVESFYSSYNYESLNKKWRSQTTLSHSRDEIDPQSLYINNYTAYHKGYKYAFNRSLKLDQQINHSFSDKSSITAGFSYEDITALPKTGDLPFAFNRDLAADFQNIYYLGTNILDRDSNDLTIPQDFYYLQYQNFGTYMQLRTDLVKNLSLTLGGRLDFNTRYESTLNPRLGLIYTPVKKFKIKLLYGSAYLAPSPYRTYQHYGSFIPVTDSVSREVVGLKSDFWRLPGNILESQRINTYESSCSYLINDNLIFAINGFYNHVKNLLSSEGLAGQSFHGIPVGIIERPINKGTANSYGGTARIDFKKSWETIIIQSLLAYTYINGEIEGKQIPYTAKNTVKGIFDVNYDKISSSDRFEMNFSLKIKNLLNSKYYNVPIGGAESLGMAPQDPIRILFGVNLSFF